MNRRDFLKTSAAAASLLGGLGGPAPASRAATAAAPPPNILFILVDELRFPSVFPSGINSPGEFLARFMPNTYGLWQRGVRFTNHFTAGVACTPARGTLITGLYTQQTWTLQTLKGTPGTKISIPPVLNPSYPTYGKLLRVAGYLTPYVGKWHLSLPRTTGHALEAYGFSGMTEPDPNGSNLQGTVGDQPHGYLNDEYIAGQAVQWLNQRTPEDPPWCLTVGFINPHDQQFFWAGTEFQTYNDLFNAQAALVPFNYYSQNNGQDYPPVVAWDDNPLKAPPALGYPALPPNWEPAVAIAEGKPSTQYFSRLFQAAVWGGVSDDATQSGFAIAPYPGRQTMPYGIGTAPFTYWQRSLDCYTQTMSIVDQRVGEVLAALPRAVADNTIIVFSSDHGEFAGAHGFAAGKGGSVYDEAYHVPLIVADPTGRFAGDVGVERTGLTSSVDMLGLLVGLGHNGSRHWMTGDLATIYGTRHDMLAMLRSAATPGREYVLLATDELVLGQFNFNRAPLHLVGLRTADAKLGTYADWSGADARIDPGSLQLEFYDYATPRGRAELDSTPDDPRVQPMLDTLLNDIIPNELRAPLPGRLGAVQDAGRARYRAFERLISAVPPAQQTAANLKAWLSYGADF